MRRQLGRLQDERVCRRHTGRNLPRNLKERVIPRGNQPAHAYGLTHNTRAYRRITSVNDASGVVTGELAEITEASDDIIHIGIGFHETLTRVQGLRKREFILAFLNTVRDGEEKLTAVKTRPA